MHIYNYRAPRRRMATLRTWTSCGGSRALRSRCHSICPSSASSRSTSFRQSILRIDSMLLRIAYPMPYAPTDCLPYALCCYGLPTIGSYVSPIMAWTS